MRMSKAVFLLSFLVSALWGNIDKANASMRMPKGCNRDAFLSISGKIDKTTNSAKSSYEMSEREFLALPAVTVTTSTPWSPTSEFRGPLLSEVLNKAQTQGKKLRLVALDDFSVEVDADYLEKYGTILATSKDGVRLSIRDFGPIFVMYPRDSFKDELDTPVAASYLVWQLCGINVE